MPCYSNASHICARQGNCEPIVVQFNAYWQMGTYYDLVLYISHVVRPIQHDIMCFDCQQDKKYALNICSSLSRTYKHGNIGGLVCLFAVLHVISVLRVNAFNRVCSVHDITPMQRQKNQVLVNTFRHCFLW